MSTDADFARPFIDVDEWRQAPVEHRYVHGGFDGTQTRFSFYLPPAGAYQGRFFQHITPTPQSENLAQTATGEEDKIGFAVSSGGYFVETNGGGDGSVGGPVNDAVGDRRGDPTVGGYRANAASAQFSRQVAREMYGDHRPYGYCYGGSGGSYRTIGGAESTTGVWDGFVPYVPGSPMALPNVFSVRMHAQRILRDKLDGIVDALEPGGSGDPYAGLSKEEAAAFTEVTRMGFPPRSWYAHRTMGTQAFSVIFPPLQMVDPGYFEDFWSVPGYLGAESGSSVQAARLVLDTRIASTLGEGAPEVSTHLPARQSQPAGGVDESWHGSRRSAVAAIRLAAPAPVDSQGAELHVLSGDAAGARLMLRAVVGDLAVLDLGNDPDVVDRLRTGDRVRVDNSNVLAAQTYHRHQVPADGGFAVWDQFRDGDGTPSHPQRPMLIGPRMAAGAAGSAQSGRFDGKMIMVASLLDREAYPWQADWYRTQVTGQLGEAADEHYRLWYVDHAVHGDESLADDPRHTVSYVGVLHHALRALAAWVEDGTPPPATTGYRVVDGQVVPAASAGERHGVQPVVRLSVDGGDRADVPAGAEVSLRVTAELPDGAGRLVSVEWDLDDDGTFGVAEPITTNGTSLALERRHAFGEAGTGFVTVRVTAQREGDPDAAFARVANIARVRVVTH